MTFQGKVVIVTGAGSGIGAAIASKFASKGAKVVLVGRNEAKLSGTAKSCRNPLMIAADVSKDEDAKKIVNETVKHFGQLDVLVNNAAIGERSSITSENAIRVFDEVMSINLRGPVLLTHFAVPHLIKTKGNIVNISSVAATRVISPDLSAYGTSKAGLVHFTRSIALELAPHGIRVNTVEPGPVKTSLGGQTAASQDEIDAYFDYLKKMTALGRYSEPEEVADLVLFVASDKAKAMTGSTCFTDNGMMIKA